MRNIFSKVFLIIFVSFSVFSFASFAQAEPWRGPTAPPPGDNASPPIHVGNRAQTKEGGLVVGPNFPLPKRTDTPNAPPGTYGLNTYGFFSQGRVGGGALCINGDCKYNWSEIGGGGGTPITNQFLTNYFSTTNTYPCTIVGLTITCGTQILTVTNGTNGTNGNNGTGGTNGTNGQPGLSGNGTLTRLTQGWGIKLTPSPILTEGEVAADPALVQRRVAASCNDGFALKKINEDGTVDCEQIGDNITTDVVLGVDNDNDGRLNHLAKFSGQKKITNSGIVEDGNGNVTIGDTSPTAKVTVLGGILGAFSARSSGGAAILGTANADNIGVRGVSNAGVGGYFSSQTGAAIVGVVPGATTAAVFTSSAGNALEAYGKVRIVDGSEGNNKVFTSDARGVGTWKTKDDLALGLPNCAEGETIRRQGGQWVCVDFPVIPPPVVAPPVVETTTIRVRVANDLSWVPNNGLQQVCPGGKTMEGIWNPPGNYSNHYMGCASIEMVSMGSNDSATVLPVSIRPSTAVEWVANNGVQAICSSGKVMSGVWNPPGNYSNHYMGCTSLEVVNNGGATPTISTRVRAVSRNVSWVPNNGVQQVCPDGKVMIGVWNPPGNYSNHYMGCSPLEAN